MEQLIRSNTLSGKNIVFESKNVLIKGKINRIISNKQVEVIYEKNGKIKSKNYFDFYFYIFN